MRKLGLTLCLLVLGLLGTSLGVQEPTILPGLHDAATIVRDSNGIPHILATNEHDLFFLQGWVHAEDRLFQMDVSRRLASGTLAEVLGITVLASDVQLRTIGLRRAAKRSLAVLSQSTLAALEAYSDGANAFMESHPLPPEYGLLDLTHVEPWSPLDSVTVAKLQAFSLSFDLDIESTVTLEEYQAVGVAEGFDGTALYFEDLFRSAPFDSASTVPDAGQLVTTAAVGQHVGPETVDLAEEQRRRISSSNHPWPYRKIAAPL